MASYLFLSVCLLLLMNSREAKAAITDGVSVQCYPTPTIMVDTALVQNLTAEGQTLILGPSPVCDDTLESIPADCYGTSLSVNGTSEPSGWEFRLNSPSECGAAIISSATTLTFRYKISSEPKLIGPIRRTECQSFEVSCAMNRETVIETPNGANVTENAVVLPAVYKTENYTTKLGFYSDGLFSTPLTTPVNINDTIYVEAAVTNAVSTYNIGVIDCYATIDPTPNSGVPTYPLINSTGQADDPSFVMIILQSNTTARFSFPAFLWSFAGVSSRRQEIYVVCTTVVCLQDVDCTEFMPTLRRRRRRSNEAENQGQQLIIGPLPVLSNTEKAANATEETSSCAVNNGGCQDVCIDTIGSSTPRCACNVNRVLRDDGLTCMDIADLQGTSRKGYTEILLKLTNHPE